MVPIFLLYPIRNFSLYRRKMQMIFQEPSRSLNPRDCVGEAIGEPFNGKRDNNQPERTSGAGRRIDADRWVES